MIHGGCRSFRDLAACWGVNNSYAGSTVAGGLLTSGTSETRLRTLGAEGEPDLILIAMGANDWGFGVPPQEFEYEYRRMLQRLGRLYPKSEKWCAHFAAGQGRAGGGHVF